MSDELRHPQEALFRDFMDAWCRSPEAQYHMSASRRTDGPIGIQLRYDFRDGIKRILEVEAAVGEDGKPRLELTERFYRDE